MGGGVEKFYAYIWVAAIGSRLVKSQLLYQLS